MKSPVIPATVLVVDDNRAILTAAELLLRTRFRRVLTTFTPERIRALVRDEAPDVVLLDMNFHAGINTGNEGLFWLSEIKKMNPSPAVVLFTAYADIDLAVRGIKEGAADFVVKPWDNERLVGALADACRTRADASPSDAPPTTTSDAMCWGTSPAMQRLRALVEKVAPTDANVLITGENGTGKGLLARELHRLSARSRRPLVTVDMGAVVETLFESELFGHVRGAFTEGRLTFTKAQGLQALGIALEDDRGVVVDNFALRGNSGLPLEQLDADACQALQRIRPYDLIVLQYGLNVATERTKDYAFYRDRMVQIVQHIRTCFPGADILLLSVSDRSRMAAGSRQTMPSVKALRRAQREAAMQSGTAFWDVFEAMGGENSMVNYVSRNWAAKDYTHLSFQGGRELAYALFDALILEKQLYDTLEKTPR